MLKIRRPGWLEHSDGAEESLGMKLEKEPRPDENFVLYSSGDRKPLEDLAQKSDTMFFKGCLKQKTKSKRTIVEAGRPIGRVCRIPGER